jgi:hypothetical protein
MSSFVDSSLLTVHDGASMVPMISGDGERSYDIYIVYDNAYRTPRIYLMGFSREYGVPLRAEEMLEDLMQDYQPVMLLDAFPDSPDLGLMFGVRYFSVEK